MVAAIDQFEKRAISLSEGQGVFDSDIYEFDFTLWQVLAQLSAKDPQKAYEITGLSSQIVSLLASASIESLKVISSGLIVSFAPTLSGDDIASILPSSEEASKFPLFHQLSTDRFESTYWLLVRNVARDTPLVARAAFGLSPEILSLVASLSNAQVRHLVLHENTTFALRFPESSIWKILNSTKETLALAVMKKIQQSLCVETV